MSLKIFEKMTYEEWTFEIIREEMNTKKTFRERIKFLKNVKVDCDLARINYPDKFNKSKTLKDNFKKIEESINVYLPHLNEQLKEEEKPSRKKHSHGPYIIWLAGYIKLEKFIRLLINNELLYDYKENDYNSIIKDHFECYSVNNNLPETANKIRWGKKLPLLVYLIDNLLNNKYKFIHECSHPYALFSMHFVDKEGNKITSAKLNSAKFKTKNNRTEKPQESWIIDKIFKEVYKLPS